MFIVLSKTYLFVNEKDIQKNDSDQVANRFLVFNLRNDSTEPLVLSWPSSTNPSSDSKESKNTSPLLISGCAAPSEDYFALCDENKNLVIFNSQFETIRHYVVKRTCVKILFRSNEKSVLTCDKAGDIYEFDLFPSKSDCSQGRLLLGHCSMLLDFTMTRDCQYIISCDRDEKIRVTHYPNTYNVLTYCLGHNEFVSSVLLLDQKTLISGSGDGKIILWDFFNGKALYSYNCDENIKDSNNDLNCKKEKALFPVKSIVADHICANYLVVSFYNQSLVYLFKVVRDSGNATSLNLLSKLPLDSEPIWMQFDSAHNNFLWILGGFKTKSIELLELKQDKLEKAICSLNIVDSLNESEQLSAVLENDHKENALDGLFKHYYNNVELYYQRKMLRIENENKTKRYI